MSHLVQFGVCTILSFSVRGLADGADPGETERAEARPDLQAVGVAEQNGAGSVVGCGGQGVVQQLTAHLIKTSLVSAFYPL